ncbi:MAG: conserved rane protein of unknown function [Microbacterium sp.]|jgi:uncharacterized membrane protein|nr:conserved rane protein of unknown function [Microbacterium sp.]
MSANPAPIETDVAPGRTDASRGWRKHSLALIFAAISLIVGTLFVLVNPPFWGNDGLSQYGRAYQISHGHILPQQIDWHGKGDSFGGEIPSSVWGLYEHAATDLGQNPAEPERWILEPAEYDRLGGERYRDDSRNVIWFSNTAAYSPVPYVPAVVGSLVAEAADLSVMSALRIMALFSLVSYIVPVMAALWVLRGSRMRWLFFSLALLPPALLQSATITADAMTNGMAFLFTALVAKATLEKKPLGRLETVLLAGTAIALPLGKPSYLILVALLALVPAARWAAAAWVKWVTLGVSAALWGIWFFATRGIGDVLAFYRADYEQSEFGMLPMIRETLGDPIGFLGNAVRTFVYRDNFYFLDLIGSSDVRVPSSAMLLAVIGAIIAAGWLPRFAVARSTRWGWVAVAVASVLGLFGTLYVTFTPVGFYLLDGVQGRYFFPLWPLLALTILLFFPLRWNDSERSERTVARAVVVIAAVTPALALLKFWYVVWVGA